MTYCKDRTTLQPAQEKRSYWLASGLAECLCVCVHVVVCVLERGGECQREKMEIRSLATNK